MDSFIYPRYSYRIIFNSIIKISLANEKEMQGE